MIYIFLSILIILSSIIEKTLILKADLYFITSWSTMFFLCSVLTVYVIRFYKVKILHPVSNKHYSTVTFF